MKKMRFISFVVAAVLILVVVGWNIVKSEVTLRRGAIHRMKIQGFDPHDPFRGRYLAFTMPETAREGKLSGPVGYVTLECDADGDSIFGVVAPKPPETGNYVKVRRRYPWETTAFKPLFSRFYLNETLAPEAERILAEALGSSKNPAKIVFRVYRGQAVLADLEINGRSIVEIAREAAKKSGAAKIR